MKNTTLLQNVKLFDPSSDLHNQTVEILVKNGLIGMLPEKISMVHGPGCPVCVTPQSLIDKAVWLAEEKGVILCSYGDMIRVPGNGKSLLEAKADGADIRILYSPLEAVNSARQNPGKEVVFFAVGFETTAPANALSVVHAQREGLMNYSILTSHVLVPPAIEAIVSDPGNVVQGFLAAGHVCTIMGIHEYEPLVQKYKLPIVVTGFEPVDLLHGIMMLVKQLDVGPAGEPLLKPSNARYPTIAVQEGQTARMDGYRNIVLEMEA